MSIFLAENEKIFIVFAAYFGGKLCPFALKNSKSNVKKLFKMLWEHA